MEKDADTITLSSNITRKKSSDSSAPVSSEVEKHQQERRTFVSADSSAQPMGWPKSLPIAPHNIYFAKRRNAPCICIDVDVYKDDTVLVLNLCTASYNHVQPMQASLLEPISDELLRLCYDDRTAPFAVALMNFAAWELSSDNNHVTIPSHSHLRKWYIFPSFIVKMVSHLPLLTEWRKQAERASRNSKANRSVVYYNCLVENYKNLEEHEIAAGGRLDKFEYPWEAAYREKLEEEEDEDGDEEDQVSAVAEEASAVVQVVDEPSTILETPCSEEDLPVVAPTVAVPVEEVKPETCGSKRALPEDVEQSGEVEPPRPTQRLKLSKQDDIMASKQHISLSIYWLDRSNLPCLYYDSKRNLNSDKIVVQPICCSTYHYYVTVTRSLIEPLTYENIKKCNDDRTIDFAGALMDFARWHLSTISVPVTENAGNNLETKDYSDVNADSDDADTSNSGYTILPTARKNHYIVDIVSKSNKMSKRIRHYMWPSCILNLVTKPREFSAFRKDAERKKRNEARKTQYFDALVALFREKVSEDSESGSSSGDESADDEGEVNNSDRNNPNNKGKG